MRKIFTDNLPKKKYGDKEIIDWKNSVGYKVHFIYEDIEDDIEIIEYKNSKLKIKYKNKEKIYNSKSIIKCQFGTILDKVTSNFKIEIGTTFKDEKRDLTIIDREKRPRYKKDGTFKCSDKWYKYHCNKCNGYNWDVESHLLKEKRGCGICHGTTICKGINDIGTTDKWIIPYLQDINDAYKYSNSSGKFLKCKCPYCGYKKEMRVEHLFRYGFGCVNCSDGISYPNKFMLNLLKQLNVMFKTEYSPEWSKNKRYDFYLSDYNILLEMNGGQHYSSKNSFNNLGGRTLEEEQQNDKFKKLLAIQNGIKEENYIVIDCRKSELEFIKNNIINSRLNEIFDLSNIDWNKIDEQSQHSIVKEVCDYWYLHNEINNEGLTTTDLSKIFNISGSSILKYLKLGTKFGWCNYYYNRINDNGKEICEYWHIHNEINNENLSTSILSKKFKFNESTIRKYLNIGSKLGWCNYNPKDKIIKSYKNKDILVIKNGEILGKFPSIAMLCEKSESLFGTKFSTSSVGRVLKQEQKSYKGYTFEYVNKQK